jgi:three-Cys-motif partner protein
MVAKPYLWESGATLQEHSKRKHKILREYFARYLAVRCQIPQQSRFRLAVVDGFSGGGSYACGAVGSPLIFIEELRAASDSFNIKRTAEGMASLNIECLLIFNDESTEAIELLKTQVEPLLAAVKTQNPRLHLQVIYLNRPYEEAYVEIKQLLEQGRYHNVVFNLDQCGHAHVERATLTDIVGSFASAEIFYTFAIESLLAFLQKRDPKLLAAQLGFLGASPKDLSSLEGGMSNNQWLGAAERLVFQTFRNFARFVSPFSINNPDGWRYWLVHLAGNYRARQEYNNVLHRNSTMQAHFGRSGLHMLSFDPTDDANALYLFDVSGQNEARKQLCEDIPRLVSEFGDAIALGEFYAAIYNMTPAHMDDVHAAIIENPDLEVLTGSGGERRKPNTIEASDTLRMKKQRSFFPLFLKTDQLSKK